MDIVDKRRLALRKIQNLKMGQVFETLPGQFYMKCRGDVIVALEDGETVDLPGDRWVIPMKVELQILGLDDAYAR